MIQIDPQLMYNVTTGSIMISSLLFVLITLSRLNCTLKQYTTARTTICPFVIDLTKVELKSTCTHTYFFKTGQHNTRKESILLLLVGTVLEAI